MAVVDVTSTVDIARPRDEVAAFAVDPDNATAWYRAITSVRWETPPPLAIGSRIAFVAEFLNRRLAYTYEVREFDGACASSCPPTRARSRWRRPTRGRTTATVRR